MEDMPSHDGIPLQSVSHLYYTDLNGMKTISFIISPLCNCTGKILQGYFKLTQKCKKGLLDTWGQLFKFRLTEHQLTFIDFDNDASKHNLF